MAYKATGYGQLTSLSAVKSLADVTGGIPASSQAALIQAESQNVRWRDDTVNPTASVGMQLAAGDSMMYEFPLTAIKFIEEAASAKLNITFYGNP